MRLKIEEVVQGEDSHLVEHDVAAALDVLHDENTGFCRPEREPAEPGASRAGIRCLARVVVAEKIPIAKFQKIDLSNNDGTCERDRQQGTECEVASLEEIL